MARRIAVGSASGVRELSVDAPIDLPEVTDLNNLKREVFIKILVLGDNGVGKSSLIKSYTESDGSEDQQDAGYKVQFYACSTFAHNQLCFDGLS